MDRRHFLQSSAICSVSSTGLSECSTTIAPAFVNIILPGGPSHLDLWDPKPSTSLHSGILTSVPGIHISSGLPKLAQLMHHICVVRGVSGSLGRHCLKQCETGMLKPERTDALHRNKAVKVLKSVRNRDPAHLASIIVEALDQGQRDCTVRFGNWDFHSQIEPRLSRQASDLDSQLAHTIETLAVTGRLKETRILVWGEFGRAPRINSSAGRDHWPVVNSALVVGGNDGGRVIGSTDRDGAWIDHHSFTMAEVWQFARTSAADKVINRNQPGRHVGIVSR